MTLEEAIKFLENAHWVTKEMEEAQRIAVDCMRFTSGFMPLKATPERMEHALNILNALEYIAKK